MHTRHQRLTAIALGVAVCTVLFPAQTFAQASQTAATGQQNGPSGASPQGNSSVGNRTSTSRQGSSSSAGRQAGFRQAVPGREMSRQRAAGQRASMQSLGSTQRGGVGANSQVRRIDPRQQFADNAMLFDFNNDQQLAANELRNLFVVLVSQSQQQAAFRRTTPLAQRLGYSSNSFSTNPGIVVNTGFRGSGTPQGSAIRDAILIFLQLVMRFDLNGDGLLSQRELNLFADALLNNELSLVGAARSSRYYSGRNTVIDNRNRNGGGIIGYNGAVPVTQQQQQQSVVVLGREGDSQAGQGRNRNPRYNRDVGSQNRRSGAQQSNNRERVYGRDVGGRRGVTGDRSSRLTQPDQRRVLADPRL